MCRSIRAIGRDCIKNRIQMIHNGEVLPNDILTLILQIAGEWYNKYYVVHDP